MSTTSTPPDIEAGQFLFGSTAYSVIKFLDEGSFGKVAKCRKLNTKEIVAVKIMKDNGNVKEDTEHEVSILETISALDPDRIHVVKFIEQFVDLERSCLVFEMLDINLYDMIEAQGSQPLSLQEIRPMAKQLLVALDALKSLGIMHTDIKPDNIMIVSKQVLPYRVKLIDFGVALHVSKAEIGVEHQPIGYRAPEIALGLPFNEAIDAWGVGCILAFLYLANNLFPVDCEYQMMKSMVRILGQPSEHQLREGIYSHYFFCEEDPVSEQPTWRLLTPQEYSAIYQVPGEPCSRANQPRSLDDLLKIHPKKDADEYADRKAFVGLLKRLLHLDGAKRISPDEALEHPFITMSHLARRSYCRTYLTAAQTILDLLEDSADQVSSFEDLEADLESAQCSAKDEDEEPDPDNSSAQEASDTGSDEDASDSSDEGVFSDEEDSDPAGPPSEILSLQSFDDDDEAALTSDEELSSGQDASDKDAAPFMDDITLESADEFIPPLEEDSADQAFTTRTYVGRTDDDCDLRSLSSGDLLSLSSDGAPGKDASHHDPHMKENLSYCYSRGTFSPGGSTDASSTSSAWSSSGRRGRIMRRIRKFFRRVAETFCCCCCVED